MEKIIKDSHEHSHEVSSHDFVDRTLDKQCQSPSPSTSPESPSGQVKTPPRPSASALVRTPAPSTFSAPSPAARTPLSRPPVAPTTHAAPSVSARQALETRGQDAAEKAEFEKHVAEKEKVKQAKLQELRSKHEEARQRLEMEQNVEYHKLMEIWRKREEDNKSYRRIRRWD
ncbi:MAG: hypothetical protein OHK93_000077 [Ramalina farinacea]|uniref:Uncharacterized protein n=1 Tax=Ramalina farinacea TaxID=258253 RepID=A0AA43QHS0_9LECA|nr:hypothetical protein [Ramalina farinacea]